ncbi:Glycosyltransferase involved in cell wall bisynthesis [Chryseobacterium soldanellicola]|uniref:Glycosyltransferase involved in cell wall bisynthesis n=1 Tax=Chryseobacterium soldanellicola TaxID=311333 RepID=A0A1H0XMP6_9FLAO|nr:glycosyltransferase family 4 protein [Chryseobacterium soldanellicola]SDQ04143.1 Glycosyltransferase involved in cell wall bisynthesis [Chryseobacterium soldanellicola]
MKIIRTSTIPLSLNVLLKGQLKFLNEFYDIVGISSEGELLEEVKQREGIKTIKVNMERGISPLKDMASLYKLYKILKTEKPVIVHSITPKAGLLTMLSGKMAGVPIRIHTFTGLIFPTRKGAVQKLLIGMDKLLCSAATHIYPEGEGVKNDLIKYKITSKYLKVIGNGNVNGIDLEYFSSNQISEAQKELLKKELHIKNEDFVFVFVGRLVGDKGINELVKAFSLLNKENNSQDRFKLLLVGPLEQDLDPLPEDILNEIKNNPDIIDVGFQKDVRPYFAISDVLAFPSYREGFPNVVMQAGAMGLPSIVSDINGCNEIIVEGENGVIVPVKNSEKLSQAMKRMKSDTNYYQKLKMNARPMIESRYEQSKVWNAILSEYKKLIKEKDYRV